MGHLSLAKTSGGGKGSSQSQEYGDATKGIWHGYDQSPLESQTTLGSNLQYLRCLGECALPLEISGHLIKVYESYSEMSEMWLIYFDLTFLANLSSN